MINSSLNVASLAGLISFISAIYIYQLKSNFRRNTGNELADLASAFFVPLILLISSLLIFFQGWRLDPVLQWAYALLLFCLVFDNWYSCRLDIGDAYSRMTADDVIYSALDTPHHGSFRTRPVHAPGNTGKRSKAKAQNSQTQSSSYGLNDSARNSGINESWDNTEGDDWDNTEGDEYDQKHYTADRLSRDPMRMQARSFNKRNGIYSQSDAISSHDDTDMESISSDLSFLSEMLRSGDIDQNEFYILRKRIIMGSDQSGQG